jgi:hypothetical protein
MCKIKITSIQTDIMFKMLMSLLLGEIHINCYKEYFDFRSSIPYDFMLLMRLT